MNTSVPPALQQLWDQGHHIEALKRLRLHTGLGLKEAKDLLERGQRASTGQRAESWMSADAQAAWLALLLGNPIEAVRRARMAQRKRQQREEAQQQEPPALPADAAADPAWLDPQRAPGEVPAGPFSGLDGLFTLLAVMGLGLMVWLALR